VTVGQHVSAGWYADPADASRLRWYDGTTWTEHVHASDAAAAVASATTYQPPSTYLPNQYQPAHQLPQNGCQECGAVPAVPVTLHEHHGMVLMQRFASYQGQWCRDCGVAMFRHAQRRTLLFGWWGFISFFVNVVNVVQNLVVHSRLRSLGGPAGRMRSPLQPVASVYASPGFAVAVVLLGVVLFGLVA
jgi:hypothetical protein